MGHDEIDDKLDLLNPHPPERDFSPAHQKLYSQQVCTNLEIDDDEVVPDRFKKPARVIDHRTIIISLLILFFLSPIVGAAQSLQPVELPFQNVRNQIMLDIPIAGAIRHIILDTGASRTSFRKALGSMGALIRVQTASGQVFAHACSVEIPLSDTHRVYLDAMCGMDLPEGQDGLLGEDFLRMFHSVKIDYMRKVVVLEP